jgi:hypothetical protein
LAFLFFGLGNYLGARHMASLSPSPVTVPR